MVVSIKMVKKDSSTASKLKPLVNFKVDEKTTTEGDIWEALNEEYRLFTYDADEYLKAARKVLNGLYEENPYKNHSRADWRSNDAEKIPRPHSKSLYWLVQMGEKKELRFYKMKWLYRDFENCDEAFNWQHRDGFHSMRWDCEKFKIACDDLCEQIMDAERIQYRKAHEDYKKADARFVQEGHDYYDHALHSPEYLKHYKNEGADILESCHRCIKEREFKKTVEEDTREFNRLEKERDDKAMERWREEDDAGDDLVCEDCEFVTRSRDHWNMHCSTARHQNNQLCCRPCKFQARSERELDLHNNTEKHRKWSVGQGKKDIYKCECCSYETPYRHVYDGHVKSKKHLKNMDS